MFLMEGIPVQSESRLKGLHCTLILINETDSYTQLLAV